MTGNLPENITLRTFLKMHRYALLSLLPVVLGCTDTPTPSSVPTPVASAPTRAAAEDGPVGFAAGTTGGGDAAATTVTSCSELEAALGSGGVISISGMLSDCGVLDVPSDTTIIGSGAASGSYNEFFYLGLS